MILDRPLNVDVEKQHSQVHAGGVDNALPDHVVAWRGKSKLNGTEILLVLYAFNGRTNQKSGCMIETAILVADRCPRDAARDGSDVAVCGYCPARQTNRGWCYRTPGREYREHQTWDKIRDLPGDLAHVCDVVRRSGLPIRFGSYGDPAAVPYEVLKRLVDASGGRISGFTHSWSHPNFDPRLFEFLSASIEFPQEGQELKRLFPSVKTYRVILDKAAVLPGEEPCTGGPKEDDNHCCVCPSPCRGMANPDGPERVVVVHPKKAEEPFRKYLANPDQNVRHVHPNVLAALAVQKGLVPKEEQMLVKPIERPSPEAFGISIDQEPFPEVVKAPVRQYPSHAPPMWSPQEFTRVVLDRDQPSTRVYNKDATWWTHQETCTHLRVDPRTVLARMRETPEHIARPWVNYGTRTRPYYGWLASGVDRWWIEVNAWRASRKEKGRSAFDGGTLTDRSGRARARTWQPRDGFSEKSRPASPKDDVGNLGMLARSLASRRS